MIYIYCYRINLLEARLRTGRLLLSPFCAATAHRYPRRAWWREPHDASPFDSGDQRERGHQASRREDVHEADVVLDVVAAPGVAPSFEALGDAPGESWWRERERD